MKNDLDYTITKNKLKRVVDRAKALRAEGYDVSITEETLEDIVSLHRMSVIKEINNNIDQHVAIEDQIRLGLSKDEAFNKVVLNK